MQVRVLAFLLGGAHPGRDRKLGEPTRDGMSRQGNCFFHRFFFFLAMLFSMWDLSSPTRDRTQAPCIGSSES